MNPKTITNLKARLLELQRDFGLTALKTGTEVEDMSFSEIAVLRRLSSDIVPLYVKTGGPEARNDIRELIRIGVDGIIAPMIESAYALKKFFSTLKEILDETTLIRLETGINLETKTAFENLESIVSTQEFLQLSQITAARSDLSGSMGLEPDDAQVFDICSVFTAVARRHGLRTSVGGGIHPSIVDKIVEIINPDTVNTRHMVMNAGILRQEPESVTLAHLSFESELYCQLANSMPSRRDDFSRRAYIIRQRMEACTTLANS